MDISSVSPTVLFCLFWTGLLNREKEDERLEETISRVCKSEETKIGKLNNLASLKSMDYRNKYENDTLKEKLNTLRKDPKNKELRDMINYVDDMMATMIACIVVIAN